MGNVDHIQQARSHSDVESRLQSQASSHGVDLEIKRKTVFPRARNGERLAAVDVVAQCEARGDPRALSALQADIRQSMEPAPIRAIEEWLAVLSVQVPMRQGDLMSVELKVQVYADNLKAYPADVARAALLDQRWRFWPSWAELADVCDQLAAGRKAMLTACIRAQNAEPTSDRGERISAQRAAEIMADMGFTAERAQAVARRPAARSVDEAMQPVVRKPHWTETVDPDGPEMQALRRSRQAAMERQRPISPAKPTERTE